MDINELKKLLPAHSPGYLATSVDASPDIRGWQLQMIDGNKIYFCTSNKKKVYAQILENPQVAFAASANSYNFRITGHANIVTDTMERQKIHDNLDDDVRSIYKDINANGFTVFYLSDVTVQYAQGLSPYQSFSF